MKKTAVWITLLLSLTVVAAPRSSETPVLSGSEYRIPLQEVIAIGRTPYWRDQQKPRWEQPELQLPPASKPRLEWAPHYSRDERDDYREVRDQLNPKPRTKLFEVHF